MLDCCSRFATSTIAFGTTLSRSTPWLPPSPARSPYEEEQEHYFALPDSYRFDHTVCTIIISY